MSSARANALKTFSVVGIALLMVWSTVAAFTAVAADERSVYIVSIDDDTSPEVFRTTSTKVLVDYNNGFYLVKATQSQAFTLNEFGLDVVKFTNLRNLDMYPSDLTFDTSDSAPSVPQVMSGFSWERGSYIVQFVGPYKTEWLDSIEVYGGKIAKYVHAFSIVVRMTPDVKSSVGDLPFVHWVGDYKPWYKISSELLNGQGTFRIAIHTYEENQIVRLSERIVEWGGSVLMSYPGTVIAYVDAGTLPWIVTLPEVMQVFQDYTPETTGIVVARIHGAFDAWYTERSGLPTTLTGRSPGPDGIDHTADDIYEVIGIQDSGFDICDETQGHPDFFLGPNGDRVIRFFDHTSASCPDGWFSGTAHGTHVAGDALSNGYAWEVFELEPTTDSDWENTEGPGMAPEALLTIDGVQRMGGGLLPSPANWDIQYADGAHINTNSYGSQPADYGTDAWQADNRTKDRNSRLIFFAASNEGPDLETLSGNTQGKNGLSIGASLNFRPDWFEADNPNLIADFSSRGGAGQSFGRLKPDLVAVGTAGVAPQGIGEWFYNEMTGAGNPQPDCIMEVDIFNYNNPAALDGDGICDYRYMGGTSAASPHAAGLGALVREYLREVGGISDPFAINSQLVKALMINGAVRMDEALYDYPGYDQGWGRINLEQSLFPQVPRTNKWEESALTTTGVWSPSYGTYVQSDEVPLKVTLVWVDMPGKPLIKNLNLRVTSPGGDVYWGNIYGTVGQFDGWSIPNPQTTDANPLWDRVVDGWDDVNNVEQVEVEFPEVGTWLIEVIGFSIPASTPFAIVTGADFGPQVEYKIDLDTESPLSFEAAENGDVFFPFSVTNFGTSNDNVFMSSSSVAGITINFDTPFFGLRSKETISSFAIISVAAGVSCGVHDLILKATSVNADPPISDQLELELSVKCNLVVTPFQLTNETVDELDPSVLTFNDGTTDWIFIAYRKTTAVWLDDKFGGVNVWVAYTELDGDGMPVLPFIHTEVSYWNDDPNDLRFTYIPSGAKANRIMLTWTGDDPEATGPMEDTDSYGVLHYSDYPYTQWNRTVMERNAGSSIMNEARVNIPLWRDDGTPDGEFLWVFEHLDYVNPDANNPSRVQTWVVTSHNGGETFGVCNAGNDPDCKRISPNDQNFYFFPNACIDSNEVVWVFFYYRTPAGNDRDLMVRLYDDIRWMGDDTIFDTSDDVSLLWNSDATNLQWPACVGDNVGGNNRMNVMVTNDQGGVDLTLWSGYLEGDYNSIKRPFSLNRTEIGISPNLHGPLGPGSVAGPMGLSISNSNYDRRPITQMVTTNDGYTWIMYIENANDFDAGNLMTVATTDAFTTPETSTLTADSYAKGHQMTDTLTVNTTRHNVYEVYHASKGTESDVNYDVYLLIYHKGWEDDADTTGPIVDPIVAVPNPFDISIAGKEVQLFATITDTSTGMSNVSNAEWIEVPTSVVDPRLIDWTGALPLTIGTDSPTETGTTSFVPSGWDGDDVYRLCARGQDEHSNWGIGACVDVATIGKKPVYREFDMTFTTTGWHLISIPLTVNDTSIGAVFGNITGNYDQLRMYDAVSGTWPFYHKDKSYSGPLTNVDKTMGIWIHITALPTSVKITGNLTYVTEIPLQPGWNLIGYPSLNATGMTVQDLLDDPALMIDTVEGFDGTAAASPYYLKTLPGGYYLQPGEGYWVHVGGSTGRTFEVPGGF